MAMISDALRELKGTKVQIVYEFGGRYERLDGSTGNRQERSKEAMAIARAVLFLQYLQVYMEQVRVVYLYEKPYLPTSESQFLRGISLAFFCILNNKVYLF